jgi:iron complex transport system permease protein
VARVTLRRWSTSDRLPIVFGGLIVALLIAIVLGVAVGSIDIAPSVVVRTLLAGVLPASWAGWIGSVAPDDPQWIVIWAIRMPRVLVAMLVGAGLAVAGVLMQGLFQNALASPDVIGTSTGGALGAVLAIVLGLSATSVVWMPLFACIGALASLAIVYTITTRRGRTPIAVLLLAGLGLNALFGAATQFLISFHWVRSEITLEVVFWLMGGLATRTWDHVWMAGPGMLIGIAVAIYLSRELDLFLAGEETAASLGVDVERVKRVLLATSALLAGLAVAVSGGLIVPHMTRFVVGPSHRRLVPAAALAGATFLIAADLLARTIVRPEEISLGVVTALAGAPFFLSLLMRYRREVGYL